MRGLTHLGVIALLTMVACGGSGSSGGGNGGASAGGNGGQASTGGNGGTANNGGGAQGGGGSANGGGGSSSQNGGAAPGGGGTGGAVGCDTAGTCADESGMTGCAHCALQDPGGPCASLIDDCANDNDCKDYAVCCMGAFPCDASCKTQFPTGHTKFHPVDACVCSTCSQSCASSCN